MSIYTDQDFKYFLIEDVGIFEWKDFDTKKSTKKRIKEDVDTESLYNRLVTEANERNKTVSQIILEDTQKRIKDEMLQKDSNQFENPILDKIGKLNISKLFTIIQNLKKIPNTAMSNLMKDIEVNAEGNLLVISSTNKNLITLFINKIATWGILPINETTLSDSNSTLVYKFYYDKDAEENVDDDFGDD